MKRKKDGTVAIPSVAWAMRASLHRNIAADLASIGVYCIEAYARLGASQTSDDLLNELPDSLKRMRVHSEERTSTTFPEVGEQGVHREFLCLLEWLDRLSKDYASLADASARLAAEARPGRPKKKELNALLNLLSRPTIRKGPRRRGPPQKVDISDDDLLEMLAIGHEQYGNKTELETLKSIAEWWLEGRGRKMRNKVGYGLPALASYLQKRVSIARSRLRSSANKDGN